MNIIFETIVGSQAYGTSTPESDIDIKGVYLQDNKDILSFGYKEQINVDKDTVYYEVRRFLELLSTANPTVLEMLFVDESCIRVNSPQFKLIWDNRHKFLTKKCRNSFGGYAVAQIKKASGLDKKMNWEKKRGIRKGVLDFCYVVTNGKTRLVEDWLKTSNRGSQENCGLVALKGMRDCYALYCDPFKMFNFKGITGENSNEVRLSSIPKGLDMTAVMHFNKDAYSIHCKEYREYQEWMQKRNTARYVDIEHHNQQIDGKNMLHCRRLIDTALEIAETGDLKVRRPNAEYLLDIRKGKVDLKTILETAETDLVRLDTVYENCNLPEEVDKDFVNELLYTIRTSRRIYNG